MSIVTNRTRAEVGRIALDAFTQEAYGGRDSSELHPDDVHTAVGDLICDLGHFLRLYAEEKKVDEPMEFDIESCFNRGMRHYDAEARLGWDEESAD